MRMKRERWIEQPAKSDRSVSSFDRKCEWKNMMVDAAGDNLLEVRNLSVYFGDTRVLKDLSFHVAKGSALAIIGPNGAAKPCC